LMQLQESLNVNGGNARNVSAMLQSICRKQRAESEPKTEQDMNSPKESARNSDIFGDWGGSQFESPDLHASAWQNQMETSYAAATRKPIGKGNGPQAKGMGKGQSGPGMMARPMESRPSRASPKSNGSFSMNRSSLPDVVASVIAGTESDDEEIPMSTARSYPRPDRSPENHQASDRADKDGLWSDSFFDQMMFNKSSLVLKPFTASNSSFSKSLVVVDMAQCTPPLTDKGMEAWCEWFQMKMIEYVSVHGSESLPQCRAEINFANNQISDDGLRALLEVFLNFEIHVARLQLSGNSITSVGLGAITDFVQQNVKAHPIWELHLAHNKIEQHAVRDFLHTIEADKRYPPLTRQKTGIVAMPMIVRLNNNIIEEPLAVLAEFTSKGLTEKVCMQEFESQDPRPDPSPGEAMAWKRAGSRPGKSYAAALGPVPSKAAAPKTAWGNTGRMPPMRKPAR